MNTQGDSAKALKGKALALLAVWFGLLASYTLLHAQAVEIVVLDYAGAITQTTASYFERGLAEAADSQATAVLIQLDTPGGDLAATLDIVRLFRNANIPIIVYITPEGGQAASAGSVITAAAHVAAMAPGTVIGAASPINADGSDIDETLYRKQVEDLKATMRNLTERRGETAVATAEQMIEDARAITADEALALGLIDRVAPDAESLLAALDGTTVEVAGQPLVLQTAGVAQRPLPLNAIEQVLAALTSPLLLGILLAVGAQALIFEVTHPGFGVAGIVGLVCIALALYGIGQLPVNYLGLGLVAFAFILLIAEAASPTHGVLGISGALMLLAGLLVLFNSPNSPEFARLSLPGALGITLFTSSFFLFIVAKALRAQRLPALTGSEGLVGKLGSTRKAFTSPTNEPPYQGLVWVSGELWRAQAEEPLGSGEQVAVKAVRGVTLQVKKV